MSRFAAALLILAGCSAGGVPAPARPRDVEIRRDRWGIPHVAARTIPDAFWGEGYAEAQDRLWQMETLRRAARGRTAEVFGAKSVPADMERIKNGYTEAELREMLESMPERSRGILAAYVRGVNAFIAEGSWPAAFGEHGVEPRAWTETDCVAIGVMMARRFGEAGGLELLIQAVQAQIALTLGKDRAALILRDLLRGSDARAPTTLHDHDGAGPPPAPRDDRHNWAPFDLEWYAALVSEADAARAANEAMGVPVYLGSNAWVVGPAKSATGHPILYGGPMMGFNAPSLCNEIHLTAPGLNVAGMSFPGTPGVMIGFNDRVAWTTTSGGADLVDIYRLELHPERDAYRWNGQWRPLESVDVEVKVAGAPSRTQTVWRSHYGPLVGPPDRKNRRAYAQAMSFWKKEQHAFDAILDFNVASSVADVARSARKIATSHNFFAIDREGHIGFWYCGAHPARRKEHDPRLPMKGDGSMDWEGLLPFERWPQAVDPPHAFFANWNNKPARAWEPSGFGSIFWGKKIVDALEGSRKLTFEQMEAIARETAYHAYLADYFAPHIAAAGAGSADEKIAGALAYLRTWDHMKRPGEPGPELVERWVKAMVRRVFGDELGSLLAQREVERLLADPLLYILEGTAELQYDFLDGADPKELGRQALQEVLKDGLDALAWNEDTVNFKGAIGRVPSERGRGTFQMTVEMAPDGPRATTLAAPGQSERADSPHAIDQLELFKAWKYKPFPYDRAQIERR